MIFPVRLAAVLSSINQTIDQDVLTSDRSIQGVRPKRIGYVSVTDPRPRLEPGIGYKESFAIFLI